METKVETNGGAAVSSSDFVLRYLDHLEIAWGVIANAGGGDWTKETKEWQEAAARWRDEYFTLLHARGRALTQNAEIADKGSEDRR